MKRHQSGWTLVEAMVVTVITAILASTGVPQLSQQVLRARRADAYDALARLQLAQERHRSHHALYATALDDLGLGATSAQGHYRLSLTQGDAQNFTVQAIAADGSAQRQDAGCTQLTLRVQRGWVQREPVACFPS